MKWSSLLPRHSRRRESLPWSAQHLSLRPVPSVRVWTDKAPVSLPFDTSSIHRDGRGVNTFEDVSVYICVLIYVHAYRLPGRVKMRHMYGQVCWSAL